MRGITTEHRSKRKATMFSADMMVVGCGRNSARFGHLLSRSKFWWHRGSNLSRSAKEFPILEIFSPQLRIIAQFRGQFGMNSGPEKRINRGSGSESAAFSLQPKLFGPLLPHTRDTTAANYKTLGLPCIRSFE